MMENTPHMPSQHEVEKLIELFNAGHYADLESQAQLLVERYPESGRAWKILGTALGVQGKDALSTLQKAAALAPNDASIHNNLGNAWKDQGQYSAAVESYRKALGIAPDFASAHNNLGNALKHHGQSKDAVESYRRAIEIEPNYADAHFNLAHTLAELGQIEAALNSYRRGLELEPEDTQMHYNLGGILHNSGHLDAAAQSYRRAVAISPDFAEAHNNLGNVLQDLKQFEAAADAYRRTIMLNPNLPAAHNNLGNALLELNQLEAAVAAFNRALSLDPDFAGAHGNLGNALHDLDRLDEAQDSYRRALALDPEYAEAHNNLGAILLYLGQYDAALTCFQNALGVKSDFANASSNLLFTLNYTATHDTRLCLQEAQAYGRLVAKPVKARYSTWHCKAAPERLRVGVVSGDLRNHPVGYALESLLEQLNPQRIELIAYSTNPKADELTARIQTHFSAWKPIYGKSDQDAAELIQKDGIHILLDLAGHTAHNRLPVFAWKPAPIQASWLGYFATTGVAEMDYLITSEVAVPKAHKEHFTETVWHLPDIWLCFTPPQQELPVNTLPALRNHHLSFGCFQRLDKISDAALQAWSRIFSALPQAQLRLASKQLGNPSVAEQFKQRLQQHGIAPTRVQLQGSAATRQEYLARYNNVDIMLDTLPYPGVTTTCEALWMGVPTLTLAGDTLLSRQGAGVIKPAGLDEWIAGSETEYVDKAIRFGSDLSKLAALRAGLRKQVLASPVFDAARFARNFEDALWGMWREKGLEIHKSEPI